MEYDQHVISTVFCFILSCLLAHESLEEPVNFAEENIASFKNVPFRNNWLGEISVNESIALLFQVTERCRPNNKAVTNVN